MEVDLKHPELLSVWTEYWGYTDYVEFGDNEAVIHKFAFTWAILSELTVYEYGDRWCFDSYERAKTALDDWVAHGGVGEPQGWHKHPTTGRCRPDGDASKEYINL